MKTPALPFTRSLALVLGAGGLLALTSCMDRQPTDPVVSRPLFNASAEVTGAGTAVVDGVMSLGEWSNAVAQPITISLPQGGTAANGATVYFMNDQDNLYLAVRYADNVPVPGPNSVASFVFKIGGTNDCDELAIVGREPQDRFRPGCGTTIELDPLQHGEAKRGNRVYEFSKPLCSSDPKDICVEAGDALSFRLHLQPQAGSATVHPSTGFSEFEIRGDVQPPEPSVPNLTVIVVSAANETCQNTVKLKNVVRGDFYLQKAVQTDVSTECVAGFFVDANQKYVASVRNEVVDQVTQQDIWPADVVVPVADLPVREGAVFVQSDVSGAPYSEGTSKRLTEDNYYLAVDRAKPLPEGNQSLTIHFQPGGRTFQCTLEGADFPAFVYAMLPLDKARGGIFNTTPDPGLGAYVSKAKSQQDCKTIVPAGVHVFLEAKTNNGKIYRTLIGPNDATNTTIVMEQEPQFANGVQHIWDVYGDNAAGKDDIGFGVVGLAPSGNELIIKVEFRAIQERGTAQFLFDLADINGSGLEVLAKAHCSKQHDRCWLAEASSLTSLVPDPNPIVDGRIDSVGDGWVSIRFQDFGAVNSAKIRLRAGVANGYDYAPDLDKDRVTWLRSNDSGNSLRVRF